MNKHVGIIGAGQLGAFLCTSAERLQLETTILTPIADSPANKVANHVLLAAYDDENAVRELCETCDVITFEFEDIPDLTLNLLEAAAASGQVTVFPKPDIIRLIKNKARQKTWLSENDFPTSPFEVLDTASYADLAKKFGTRFVQKAQTGGIDGRGVQVIDVHNQAQLWQAPSLVEAFVEHEKELAVLVARSANNDIKVYPVVEQKFSSEANILIVANSPAELSTDLETQAKALGADVVQRLDGVGIFAIELFLTESGELLINEISPRVHNSGHLSIDAHVTCQYAQHLRAITGNELGDVSQREPAAMANLLYTDALADFLSLPFSNWPLSAAATLYWYGKSEARQGRKMGHITATGASLNEATERAINAKILSKHDGETVT